MKRKLTVILAAACILSFTTCLDEKDPVEPMMSGFMTGYTDSEGYISVINDDFGKQYMISEKSDRLNPDTLYRIVASLALGDNNSARIQQMVKTMSYTAPEDSIIHDSLRVKHPIEIVSTYIGGGYLNIYVAVKVAKENSPHRLFYTHQGDPGRPRFTIYHNAYDDGQVYTKHAYISIPLSGYGLTKNDTVSLSCKGYQEDYDLNLIYR